MPPRPTIWARLLAWAWPLVERGDPVVALGATWLALLVVQNASPNIIGIDGYYHIKAAWLMRQHGLRLEFPWLPLTILNPRDFTNHHLLYHMLLVPFTFCGDLRLCGSFHDGLRLGGKAAALVFSVLSVFGTYLVMSRLRVRFPFFWLFVLLGSGEWFLARGAMTRRQSVSLILMLLACYLMIRGRYRWLAPVAFAYAWVFDGYVLLLVVAGLAFGARLIADRTLAWPILGWTGLGLGLSVLLHPYFPNNVTFTLLHILPKLSPGSFAQGEVRVGTEWYPFSVGTFIPWAPGPLLTTSWLALALVPLGLLPAALALRRVVHDRAALFLGGVAMLFLGLYLNSRRFIETEPAFAILFCAYLWTYYPPRLHGRTIWQWVPSLARPIFVIALVVGLAFQVRYVVQRAQRGVQDRHHFSTFQAPAQLIEQSSAAGEPIYQTDWDDFPELFFYNTHNTYQVGLDPTYMYLENPDLYRLWRDIGRGEVENPGAQIRDRFGARWVLSDRQHRPFMDRAAQDPDLELVYETSGAVVYRVRP